MELSDMIKAARAERGYSLRDLARIVGVSKSTVSRWESGYIGDIKRDKVVRLSQALGISISDIMGWNKKLPSEEGSMDLSQTIEIISKLPPSEVRLIREFAELIRDRQGKP